MSSSDTTIAGVRALPSTPIMTGDRLRVGAGAAVIELGKSTRITLGRNTEATFEGKQNDRMTLLSYGGLSFHRPKEGVEFRLRAGNISIVPISGLDTRAEVEMSGKSLVVASREGSVRVEGNGRIVEVAKGKAIKFFPETYQTPGQAASPGPSGPVPPQIPASAGNTRGGPHWGHWAWCMVTGSALGAIPPLVSEHSISPHRWEWVFVPAGGAVGGLICELIPEPPPPPPPTCQLSLTQSPAPGMPFTLSWASQNATTLNIQPARGPVRVPSGSVPVAGPGKFIMTATGPGGTDTCKVDACGIPDVQSLLLHVPVSPSSSRIYVTGPYPGGAMLVEDGVDTSSRTPPPVARLQAGLSGEPGSFCAYWIDDAVIRIGDKGPAPPNYHRVTTKFDHAVRMAWTKQGDPTRYGVTPAHRTMTVYPYGGVKPAPYALIGDATVGRAPVTFGIGDFAAEPVVSRKAVAPPLLGGMDNRSRAPGVIETALSFAQPFLPAALRPAQAADRGCLSQALVVDGGDKKGWVMDLAAAEAADAGLMDVWLRGQNFKVNRISQYWGNAIRAYANGTENTRLLRDIAAYAEMFTITETGEDCHHEFFLYISSHGIKTGVRLYDSDGGGVNQLVPFTDIYTWLSGFPTDREHRTTVYVMVDACKSGGAINAIHPDADTDLFTVQPNDLEGHWALQVITATDGEHFAVGGHNFTDSATEDFMEDTKSLTSGFKVMVQDAGGRNPQRLRSRNPLGTIYFNLDR